jgi:signal peptidase
MAASGLPLPLRPVPAARWARRWLDHAASAILLGAAALLLALGISMLVGYRVLIDRSDSMRPAIAAGDLVVTKRSHPAQISEGDIVTFSDHSRRGELVTHRVVRTRDRGGKFAFVTRGDANGGVERWSIDARGALGKFAFRIPKLGYPLSWFTIPGLRLAFVTIAGLILAGTALRRIWAA